MKGDCDDHDSRELLRRYRERQATASKSNSFLEKLLQKEEEVALYKDRLKELETAFYYNLELISERDLELTVLENQLMDENNRLQQVIQERDELEDILKCIDGKSCKKIAHLEQRLELKEEEIKKLQSEKMNNVKALKRVVDNTKQQQEKKIFQLNANFELQKNELIKSYQEEIEEKEKYYLLEIDNLVGRIEEVSIEKEALAKLKEENKCLKHHLAEQERLFHKKENYYIEEIKKINKIHKGTSQEVQCRMQDAKQVGDKKIQAAPETNTVECQTCRNMSATDDHHQKKIAFLQEQNEVLKWVIKDLKKNRDHQPKIEDTQPTPSEEPRKCAECFSVKAEIQEVNKKFESEINNLKKILNEEQLQRAEEEVIIQSLESSVTCLKDKLLMGLQQKLEEYKGNDMCSYTYNREIQHEIQVSLLEQKLSRKIDALITTTEQERRKLYEKLEDFKKEYTEKMEKLEKPDSIEIKSENLLQKIRLEIHKLENKIESDMKNMVRNNSEKDKCDKKNQTRLEFQESTQIVTEENHSPRSQPGNVYYEDEPKISPRIYYRNDISPKKCLSVLRGGKESSKIQNELRRKRLGEQKSFRRLTNDLVMVGM